MALCDLQVSKLETICFALGLHLVGGEGASEAGPRGGRKGQGT